MFTLSLEYHPHQESSSINRLLVGDNKCLRRPWIPAHKNQGLLPPPSAREIYITQLNTHVNQYFFSFLPLEEGFQITMSTINISLRLFVSAKHGARRDAVLSAMRMDSLFYEAEERSVISWYFVFHITALNRVIVFVWRKWTIQASETQLLLQELPRRGGYVN